MNLDTLKQRLAEINATALSIRAKAEQEQRDFTVEEAAELDACLSAFDRTKADIDRHEKLAGQTDLLHAPTGRKSQPDQPASLTIDDDGAAKVAPPKPSAANLNQVEAIPARYRQGPTNWGFNSLGEFALSVKRASRDGGEIERRLAVAQSLAAASTYGNEATGADGGFAVPPDFRSQIMALIMAEDSLLSRCDQVNVSSNTFTCPVDETTAHQSSGGILAYWDGEAAAATQSKPSLQERTLKLNKLRALVPLTDELTEDASAMDSYLRRKAPEKIAFKVNDAILNGTGNGQPLGVINSVALKSIAKEGSQIADSVIGRNITKMYAAMYAGSKSRAVWVVNPDVTSMLYELSMPGKDNDGNFVTGWGHQLYIPPGGLSGAPYGTLMGRPVIESHAAKTIGDLGDILFVDFSQYLALLKSGPNPRVDTSIHLWFDQDLTAFKFTLRMGGMPWWSTTMSALNGSATYSPYVALQAR